MRCYETSSHLGQRPSQPNGNKMYGMVTERRNGMRKQEKDIALFVAFCIEVYGAAKGMNGEQVLDLFYQV